MSAPKRIWLLSWDAHGYYSDWVDWREPNTGADRGDVEYILASEAEQRIAELADLKAENERLRMALAEDGYDERRRTSGATNPWRGRGKDSRGNE